MKKIVIPIIIIIIVIVGWKLARPLFVDDVVDEVLPEEFAQMTPEEQEQVERDMVEQFKDVETVVEEEILMQGPTIQASGMFVDADSFHKGEGLAKIVVNDERALLRLEDFMVTNGPDLHVLLSDKKNPVKDDLGNYIDLGSLKGNVGNQNYDLPEGVDVRIYQSVIIYCKPFHVVFSTASLE